MNLAERKLELMRAVMALNSEEKIDAALEAILSIEARTLPQPPCNGSWEENEQILIDRINKFDEVGGIPSEEVNRRMDERMASW